MLSRKRRKLPRADLAEPFFECPSGEELVQLAGRNPSGEETTHSADERYGKRLQHGLSTKVTVKHGKNGGTHDLLLFQRTGSLLDKLTYLGEGLPLRFGHETPLQPIHTVKPSLFRDLDRRQADYRWQGTGTNSKASRTASGQDMKGKTILPVRHIHLQYYSLGLAKVDCETKTKDVSASGGGTRKNSNR